jgi:predicted ABC-type ATPase
MWVPGPYDSYLAAALAEAVRRELLDEGQTFTFETVMSHPSKIEFMEAARARGYRVYLYFVATDDPDINIDRVHRRVLQGGHPVADEKVVERYHRSIDLMTRACAVAHRAYIFDNSGSKHKLLAEVTDFETIRLDASLLNPWFLGTELWQAFS